MTSKLETLNFDNRFTRELPGDPELRNFCRQVQQACYSRVMPTPVSKPQLLAYATEVGELLDIEFDPFVDPLFADVFGGNEILPGMDPFAMCYGGHQFGNWAGQLGDGRAINLGEVVNRRGDRWMLQLKGAGPTPYSRTADGLAVMRSSVREFLCSEAMFHLGVPTTRALCLVGTGERVVRDMFYDGNPRYEPGAVVCRVAPSFTRFGNFQIFAARGDVERLRKLVFHTIGTDFPHLNVSRIGETNGSLICDWFAEVCRRTAEMVVHWMRVGFVHGVMNTDNMSILGLTIDYGPYGWLEDFDPNWTPNTTDASGKRYCFGNQPQVAHWNLWQLANALVSLVDDTEPIQAALNEYASDYDEQWLSMMAKKLGLVACQGQADRELFDELLITMQLVETDMTIYFRSLANLKRADAAQADDDLIAIVRDAYYSPGQLNDDERTKMVAWLRKYLARLDQDSLSDDQRRIGMNQVNPKYVLRNYLAQLAIDKAEVGDNTLMAELLDVMRKPYDEQPERSTYAAKRPEWARKRAGCSMLSCSS